MANPWEKDWAQQDQQSTGAPWEKDYELKDDPAKRALPAGVKPSAVAGGRGNVNPDPVRQMPAGVKQAEYELADIQPTATPSTGRAVQPDAPKRESVLEDHPASRPWDMRSTLKARKDIEAMPQARAEASMQETPLPTQIGMDLRNSVSNPAARGVMAGLAGLGTVIPGAVQAGADLVGADGVADYAGRVARTGEQITAPMRPNAGGDKLAFDIANSITQTAPTLIVGLGGGPAMTALFGQAAAQEYTQGRSAGLDGGRAAARAGIMAGAEVLGERFGFSEQLKILKGLANRVPAEELAPVFARQILKEIPGEQLTTLLQFLGDKAGPGALNPEATLADYLQQAGDTLKVTIGQTAVMGGAPVAINAARQHLKKPVDRTPQIKALRAQGDEVAAAHMEQRAQKEQAAYSADVEAEALANFSPELAQRYRETRITGAKMGDAVVQTAARWNFEQAAQVAGLTPKAQQAIADAITQLPPEKVPGFVQKAITGLVEAGVAQPFDGMDQIAANIENQRDQMLDSVLGAMDDINQLEAQQDATQAAVDQGIGTDAGGQERQNGQAIQAVDPAAAEATGDGAPAVPGVDQPVDQTALNGEWQQFPQETETLGVPRAEMPQVKTVHRGPLVNFLGARGVTSEQVEVDPADLKPTQAEFSQTKVQEAADRDTDRSILISSDGYIIDGHHQAIAKLQNGKPVRAIRLGAPAADLLPLVREFPSSTTDQSSDEQNATQPSGNAGQATQTQAVEAPAPARGDGAADMGIPTTGAAGDIQADGLTQTDPDQQRRDFMAAEKKRADKRARLTRAEWEKKPLREFLGRHGVSMDLAKEFAPGTKERRKAMVAGHGPIFRKAGKNIDMLAEAAAEEGFTSGEDADALYELIGKVFRGERVAPLFAEGVAESEMEDRMRRAQEDNAAEFEDFIGTQADDPFGALTDDEIAATGYDAASDEIRAEVDALIAMAESMGIDIETLREDAARATADKTEQDYYEQAREIFARAIGEGTGGLSTDPVVEDGPVQRQEAQPAGRGDRSQADGGQGQQDGVTLEARPDGTLAVTGDPDALKQRLTDAGIPAKSVLKSKTGVLVGKTQADKAREVLEPPALTAPTKADIEAQQARSEQAARDKAAADRAADRAAAQDEERKRISKASEQAADTFELGGDAMANLTGQQDIFASAPAPAPAPKAAPERAGLAKTATTSKVIEDAGEKIGGARKDRWKDRGLNLDDLESMPEAEGAELATKANVWKPDYEALATAAEPVTAAMIKTIYDQLAAKPKDNNPEGRRQYVRMMRIVRDVYTAAKGPEAVKNAYLDIRRLSGLNTSDPAEKAAARKLLFSVYKGRSDPFVLGYNELAKAKKMVADGFPDKGDPWKTRLVVVGREGGPGVTERGIQMYTEISAELGTPLTREQIEAGFFRVMDKKRKTLAMAASKEDAEAAAKTIYERDMKGWKDGKPEPERPHLDELKRENLPKRIDRDATADDFIRDLGFRGVEFGNWSAQDERQRIINMAYDGLMDLAEIMGVPPKAMSLNGTLGMAFGARGGGRFLAHYEPGKLVINMTKLRGGGSLAHEWAHALDHYFGELNTPDAYTTKARGASGWYDEAQYKGVPVKRTEKVDGQWKTVEKMRLANLRPEMAAAFDNVMQALFQKQITKAEMVRGQELDLERTQALAREEQDPKIKAMYQNMAENKRQALEELRQDPEDRMYAGRGRTSYAGEAQALSGNSTRGYWTRPTEMFARAFESWVFDRVTSMGARSDYLVHGVEADRFAGGEYKGNPYPTGEERARINAAFQKLADTIQTKTTDDGNVPMFQRIEEAQPFYSELARQIEKSPMNQGLPAAWGQYLDALAKRGAVKADEVEWTGLREWLNLQTGKVTKAQIAEYLDANGVQVTETVLGQPSEADIEMLLNDEAGEGMTREEAIDYLNNDEGAAPTKYSQYTLPGGENYREVLLTLPVTGTVDMEALKDRIDSEYRKNGNSEAYSKMLGELQALRGEAKKTYKSAHWEQPNVLAHIRVNDRTDADGKRVLFVEELQSDWAADGRKKGFAGTMEGAKAFYGITDATWASLSQEDRQGYVDEMTGRRSGVKGGIPRAPFVENTDKWLALSLKRIMKMAVDGGYDRVAFVTGEQSAERYSLDKQISKVEWITRPVSEKGANSTPPTDGTLRAWDKNGQSVIDQQMEAAELGDNIGKELAQKLIDMKPSRQTGAGKDVRELAGIDLKVPAKGMRDFYDKIVPAAVKDALKKVGGGQMEAVDIRPMDPNELGRLMQPGFTITDAMREKVAGGLPLFQVDGGAKAGDTADHGQPDTRPEAEYNIGVLDRAIARHLDGARAGTAVHPYDARILPGNAELSKLAEAFGSEIQGFRLRPDLLAEDREKYGYFGGVRTGGIVFLRSDDGDRPHLAVLGHELGHELASKRPDLYNQLVAAIRPYVNQAKYPEFLKSVVARDVEGADKKQEEFIGEVLSDGFMDPDFWRSLGRKNQSLLEYVGNAIFDLIEKALKAVGYTKRSAPYLTDYKAVMRIAGEIMAEFGVAPRGARGDLAFASIDQTQTAAFKRWFGDSKVVEDGRPKVMYHGTRADFTAFDRKKSASGLFGTGFYFTDDRNMADEYADGGRVMDVYLSIKNPAPQKVANEVVDRIGEDDADGIRAEFERLGYDGVLMKQYGETMAVAFRPEQIKSATGNRGTFDPDNADIRFQTLATADDLAGLPPEAKQIDMLAPNVWSAPEPTKTDRVIYELQDGRIDLKRVQEAIKAAGAAIPERFDARLAETLYPGRVATRAQRFLDEEVKPLLEAMARNNVEMDELADYLHARGAKERNAQIAKVNPDLPDGGAGKNSKGVLMTNAAADAHLALISPARKMALDAMARRVDAITKGTRQLLVAEGLEKQETIDAWEKAYKTYVPMFRDEAESGNPHPTGNGMSVRGSASKRATGSTKKVTNILAHVLMQREAAITRAEKNRVAVSLYGLALSNPNREFWTTIRPGMKAEKIAEELERMGVDPAVAVAGMSGQPTITTVDPTLGTKVSRPNPIYKSLPGAITVRVRGEDRVLMLNTTDPRGARMAENLKNLDGLTKMDIAGSLIGKTTRWMASVNTQYNPAFGLVNLIRDAVGGSINLSSTPLRGKTLKVLALTAPALKGIAMELSGRESGEWGKLFRQFQADGGQTGFRDDFKDAAERTKQLAAELKSLEKHGHMTHHGLAGKLLGALDIFNTTLENAVRLAAYREGVLEGMSRPAAARLGRELTVDFNRKGRIGREAGPLYAFFNASVQGSARTIETLKGPAGQKIIAGGLMLGVMQAIMLLAAGYDDDEIPEFAKSRALIIPLPWMEGKQYLAIPLPLGLHVLPNTGRVLTELTLDGGRDAGGKLFNALGEIAGAFNPLGGGNVFTPDGALKTLAPTAVDWVIEMEANKNFAGKPIEREKFGDNDQRPGFERAREGTQRQPTGQAYIEISRVINKLTGGDDYEAGKYSPTPEMIRYLAQVAGGGLLREAEKIVNTTFDVARGEDVKPTGVPIFGRLYGEVDDEQVQRKRFYDNLDRIARAENVLNAAAKKGDAVRAEQVLADKPEAALGESANDAKAAVAKLNKAAAQTIGDRETSKALDEARTGVMRGLNQVSAEIDRPRRESTAGAKLKQAMGLSDAR